MCIIIAMQHYFYWFLEWYAPRDEIDDVEDEWDHANFEKVPYIIHLLQKRGLC
jgi:phosphatidylinositol glycan class A protein